MEWLNQIISSLGLSLSWPDRFFWIALFDILLVYYLVYRGLLLLKGTKAVRMLLGLLLIIAAYFMSKQFGLQTFSWLLDQFFSSFILVVLIVFQEDLRRGLSRVGINPFQRGGRLSEDDISGLDEIVKASNVLSTKKIGALIVIEREGDIRDYVQEGTALDAVISEELLFSLFLPYSPLHDGAAVIHQGRVTRAGCFLPLTQNPEISRHLGTRHRAAIGLTEATDALVIVVSETDGQISLCRDGQIVRGLGPSALYNELLAALWPRAKVAEHQSASPEAKAAEKKPDPKPAEKKPEAKAAEKKPDPKPAAKPFRPTEELKKSFKSEIRTTTNDGRKPTETRLKPFIAPEPPRSPVPNQKKEESSETKKTDEIKFDLRKTEEVKIDPKKLDELKADQDALSDIPSSAALSSHQHENPALPSSKAHDSNSPENKTDPTPKTTEHAKTNENKPAEKTTEGRSLDEPRPSETKHTSKSPEEKVESKNPLKRSSDDIKFDIRKTEAITIDPKKLDELRADEESFEKERQKADSSPNTDDPAPENKPAS
jgi:uncharacterized protein (TIGR00159 family)